MSGAKEGCSYDGEYSEIRHRPRRSLIPVTSEGVGAREERASISPAFEFVLSLPPGLRAHSQSTQQVNRRRNVVPGSYPLRRPKQNSELGKPREWRKRGTRGGIGKAVKDRVTPQGWLYCNWKFPADISGTASDLKRDFEQASEERAERRILKPRNELDPGGLEKTRPEVDLDTDLMIMANPGEI
ncbi:hypothetical protein B0H17DRAFT_1176618 [Mycena rosella]|uniref:Uncharacterized protein n=1 Tax=Mycena rosella TaxID=1033263 RepID=A0AAD7DXN2_MYCRO|nr:hypothetical protein B0H17DRAFT_1176618 [Mycena rosella]